MAKKIIVEPAYYMLIDITETGATKIDAIAKMREVQLLGRLKQAYGRKVIAPPLAGRGFTKLELEPLQYLVWNTFGQTPGSDYGNLVAQAFALASAMPKDDTPLAALEAEVARICPEPSICEEGKSKDPDKAKAAPKAPKEKREGDRPLATSTTGLVWVLADQALAACLAAGVAPDDWKKIRAEVVILCQKEDIKDGTIGVQYGKWKNDLLAKRTLSTEVQNNP